MSDRAQPIVYVYYVPQAFPCGPDSSCCGPVGQTEEEIRALAREIAAAASGIGVEVIDAGGKLRMGRDLPVIKLLNTFGAAASPIIVVSGEVISMGPPPEARELVSLVRAKLEAEGDRAASGAA